MNNEEFAQKNTCCLKKVLVTGASGFIGSFLVEGGLEREMQVWAGVRKSSSRTYLKDPRIQFAELDFAHPGRLTEQLAVHKQLHGGWDYIIHCAGVTKCRHKDEFDKGNYVYTRNLSISVHLVFSVLFMKIIMHPSVSVIRQCPIRHMGSVS